MTFKLTEEQQKVVDYIELVEDEELVLIDSVAGSGKTTLLRAISSVIDNKPGCYLAYNKAVATESKKKFPDHIDCEQFAFDLYSLMLGYNYYHILLRDDSSRKRQEAALDRLINAYQ